MPLAIGDTIKVEVAFNNYIKHDNPGSQSEAEGWAGVRPHNLLVSMNYARTDTVRNIIKKYGNCLTYDLICLTQGGVLEPVTVDGLRGDEDITVNGSIKEPGGPAISGTTGVLSLTESGGITVYPNPANDHITLQLNNILPGTNYILRINSITGKMMQEKIIDVIDANQEFVIPTDNLAGGIYLVTLSGSNYIYKSKFIKLK